jgi:hypothetical protein
MTKQDIAMSRDEILKYKRGRVIMMRGRTARYTGIGKECKHLSTESMLTSIALDLLNSLVDDA